MLKWLLGLGLLVVLAVGAGGYFLYANLDHLVERAIEEAGTDAAGVPVRVGRVDVDLEARRVAVFGVTVGNPPGFTSEAALTLGEISIELDLDSLRERMPLILNVVKVDSAVVFYELNAERKSNLEILSEHASRGDPGASTSGENASNPESSEIRIQIRKLVFANGRVEANTESIGGNILEARLATARLSNVGGSRGATGTEISKLVLEELGRQTILAIGLGQVGSLLKDTIGDKGAEIVEGILNGLRL